MFWLHNFRMRFPYESSCFLLDNLLMRFHSFEPLRDVLMRFHAFRPQCDFLMRFHAYLLDDFLVRLPYETSL
jgi:hypothetical protein